MHLQLLAHDPMHEVEEEGIVEEKKALRRKEKSNWKS